MIKLPIMNSKLILVFVLATTCTIFAQDKNAMDQATTLTPIDKVVAKLPDAKVMTYASFRESGELKGAELAIFDAIEANEITPCTATQKTDKCFTASSNKFKTCREFDQKVANGSISFTSVAYGGCKQTDTGIEISIVAERAAPVKREVIRQ